MVNLPDFKVYQVKVTLCHTDPPIWRRVLLERFTSLGDLHDVIQAVMPWKNYHLHQFTVGEKVYGEPETDELGSETLDESQIDLETLYEKKLRTFSYEYDFGDGWEHEIKIEKGFTLTDPILLPHCIDGKRACPPEDSGGPHGFVEKLKALKNPKRRDHEEIKDWMGDFDPRRFSADAANALLHKTFFEEPNEELLEHFKNTCGWCGSELANDREIFSQGIRFNPDLDFESLEGKVFPIPLNSNKPPVLCFIPKENTPARKNGEEGLFQLCSKKCRGALCKAFTKDFIIV